LGDNAASSLDSEAPRRENRRRHGRRPIGVTSRILIPNPIEADDFGERSFGRRDPRGKDSADA
jgi:hypothetical protein